MKKNLKKAIFILAIGIGTLSCKKENLNTSNYTQITTSISKSNEVLKFESINEFESFATNEDAEAKSKVLKSIKDSKFSSYLTSTDLVAKSGDDTNQEMDDFLGQLLNKDCAIVIGDHLYKVDLKNESVYALAFAKNDDYSTAISKINKLDKDVLKFSTDDNVLELVRNGNFESKASCDGAASFDEKSVVNSNYGTSIFQFQAKYFKGGIYFRVTVTAHETIIGPGIYMPNAKFYFITKQEANTANNFKAIRLKFKPCDSDDRYYFAYNNWEELTRNVSKEYYSKIKALHGYRFWIRGKVEFGSTSLIFNNIDGSGDFFGREINSNF